MLDACKSGKLAEAKQLVSEGANLNYEVPSNQYTPLMAAIEFKQADIIDWLISKPTVDVDRHNKWKNTALHYAVKYSEDSVMVAKLGNRMKAETVNLKNEYGETAVELAVRWDNGKVRALQGLLSVQSIDFHDTKLLDEAK